MYLTASILALFEIQCTYKNLDAKFYCLIISSVLRHMYVCLVTMVTFVIIECRVCISWRGSATNCSDSQTGGIVSEADLSRVWYVTAVLCIAAWTRERSLQITLIWHHRNWSTYLFSKILFLWSLIQLLVYYGYLKATLYQRSHRKKDKVSLHNNIYLKVTKFSGKLNLAILYLTKLAHTKFSNYINTHLSIDAISHAFYRFSVYWIQRKQSKTLKLLNLVYR